MTIITQFFLSFIKSIKLFTKVFLLTLMVFLTACQTIKPKPVVTDEHLAFSITGKIGITTQTQHGKEASSAFYTWSQEDDRFGINLTGALGIGAADLSFNGKTAKLISERTGEISATSPEELLQKATGLNAPISYFRFWIIGKPAPNDTNKQMENGRLISSENGDWTAKFYYQNSVYPNRLIITHADGHRLVMTINHLNHNSNSQQ